MRSFLLITICIILAPVAHADHIDRAIEILRTNSLPMKWQDESRTAVPAVTMTLKKPGQLILTRTVVGGPAHSYAVEVSKLYRPTIRTNVRVKSTSCGGVRSNLRCQLRTGMATIEFNLRPLDNGPALRPIGISTTEVADDVIAAHLPELKHTSSSALKCDDWSWAKNSTTGALEIQDVGLVFDTFNTDLGAATPANIQLSPGRTCDVNKQRSCDVLAPSEKNSIRGAILSIPLFSWYLELDRGAGQSCTTQFQAEASNIFELATQGLYSKDSPVELSPADRARIQGRLTSALIESWTRTKFREVFENESLFALGREEQMMIVQNSWLRLFRLTDNEMTGTETSPNGNSVGFLSATSRVTEKN